MLKEKADESIGLDKLHAIVQDSHLNFLFGAGTSSSYFGQLGNVEKVLTEINGFKDEDIKEEDRRYARASVQGYFFGKVLLPNLSLLNDSCRDDAKEKLLKSYRNFLNVLNFTLIKRRNTSLGKQANLFTTNVDMVFEVALEGLGINFNDGFSGKINPRLDTSEFGVLRSSQSGLYGRQSDIPVFNLFKIHGSAGWRKGKDKDDIYFDHSLETVAEVNEDYEKIKGYLVSFDALNRVLEPQEGSKKDSISKLLGDLKDTGPVMLVKDFPNAYSRLNIVNPEKTKFQTTVLNKTYYEMLRRFANELEKENSVLFVHGFSFQDEHLADLVLRAANTNPTLQVIVFCYSFEDVGSIRGKLESHGRIRNNNVLFLGPKSVTDKEFTLDVIVEKYFSRIAEQKK